MGLLKIKRSIPVERIPSIAPASSREVITIQGNPISLSAEIVKNSIINSPFSYKEARLKVKVLNEGQSEVENLSIEALVPDGVLLVDPGILFGTTRRHVRLPRLAASKSITYKLGVRAREGFTSGAITIEIRENAFKSEKASMSLKIALLAN